MDKSYFVRREKEKIMELSGEICENLYYLQEFHHEHSAREFYIQALRTAVQNIILQEDFVKAISDDFTPIL